MHGARVRAGIFGDAGKGGGGRGREGGREGGRSGEKERRREAKGNGKKQELHIVAGGKRRGRRMGRCRGQLRLVHHGNQDEPTGPLDNASICVA